MQKRINQFDREELLAKLRSAYMEGGLNIRELATLYGVSYSTMHYWLSLSGVAMRPRHDHHPIGAPLVAPISLPCPKCRAGAYKRCRSSYDLPINDFHVARRRAAADEVDNPCET